MSAKALLPVPLKLLLARPYAIWLRIWHWGHLEILIAGRPMKVCFRTLGDNRAIKRFTQVEPEFLEALIQEAAKAKVIYDVGAHIGLYALVAAHCNPDSNVFAFEPEPTLGDMIERSAALNGFHVQLLRMCVGDDEGTVRLSLQGTQGHSVSRASTTHCRSVEVAIGRLDRLVEIGRVPPPNLVKIDVEGYEGHVLRGMARILQKNRPVLLLELHSEFLREYGESSEAVLDLLKSYGYESIVLRSPHVGRKTGHKQTHVACIPTSRLNGVE